MTKIFFQIFIQVVLKVSTLIFIPLGFVISMVIHRRGGITFPLVHRMAAGQACMTVAMALFIIKINVSTGNK